MYWSYHAGQKTSFAITQPWVYQLLGKIKAQQQTLHFEGEHDGQAEIDLSSVT